MKCDYCDGDGVINCPKQVREIAIKPEYFVCPKCKGTGEIPDKKSTPRTFVINIVKKERD